MHVSSVHRARDPRIFEKECATLAAARYSVTLIAAGDRPTSSVINIVVLPKQDRRLLRALIGTSRAMLRAVRLRPAIIHIHDPELIPWAVFPRLLGIKLIFDSHEHLIASVAHKTYLKSLSRRVMSRVMALLVFMVPRLFDGIVAATPQIAEEFKSPNTVVVRNLPILANWTHHEISSIARAKAKRLVYVGGISAARGLWTMLDLMENLGGAGGYRLTLAGPMIPESLLAEATEHPGWKHVIYHEWLDRGQVADLLGESTLGLLLLNAEPNYVGSLPTKLFEYMAAGLPTLASDFPAWQEMIQADNVGLMVAPSDTVEIATAARSVLDDSARWSELSANGSRIAITKWSWAPEGDALVGLYDKLLDNAR